MAIDRDGDGPSLTRDDTKPRSGGDDLRATPFTDDVFNDDDYYSRRPTASKGGRSFTLIAGVVIGLAIVGGVAWYALKGGAMNRLVPGDPQTVEADPNPYKIKPENPGGMQVENQDKLVYDRVAKGAAPNRVENLLPPAEEPKAPPQKPKAEPEPAKAASADADKKALETMVKAAQEPAKAAPPEEPAKVEAPKAAEPPKPVQVAEAPKAEPPKPVEAPKPAAEPKVEAAKPDPLVAAVAAATGKPVEAPKAEAPKAEPPKAAAPAETKTAALTAAPAVAGAFQIQLVSVPSEEAANTEWKRISRKHQDLAALTPSVTKAELPEKGTVYRLRAGPLPDKAAADALCATLAAEKTGCIVIKP